MRLMIAVMVAMFVVGMTAWVVLYTNYSQLVADVRRSEYKTPLIKLIIRKYTDCKRLDIKVRNAKAFVEKILNDYELCGLAHENIEKLARAMEYLIVMLAVLSALFFKDNYDAMYVCVIVGALSALALHLFRRLADIERLHRIIVMDMVDYLENSGDLPLLANVEPPVIKRLTGKAYQDFVWLNRCFNKIQASKVK